MNWEFYIFKRLDMGFCCNIENFIHDKNYWKYENFEDITKLLLKKGRKNVGKKLHLGGIEPLSPASEKMMRLPARPRRLHTYVAYKTSTDLDGPKDFPICILKSFTFLELPFNYLSFGTIFIPCGFCFRLHCVLDQRD